MAVRLKTGRLFSVTLCEVPHGVVDEDEGCHGFDHGDGAGQYTRVMAATARERGVFEFGVNRLLGMHYGGGRFEGDSKLDGGSVGNPALHAATAL